MSRWNVLDLRTVATEWRQVISEEEDRPDTYAEDCEVYARLCAELGVEPEPDSLDWYADNYEPTLISERYFTNYAKGLAEDIGAFDPNAGWPLNHIDWEDAADALKQDYIAVEFDGLTYYIRA